MNGATAVGVLALTVCPVLQAQYDDSLSRATLAGVQQLHVRMVVGAKQAPACELDSATLRTDVELRLREAGVRVADEQRAPYLSIIVTTAPLAGTASCLFTIELDFLQRASVARDHPIPALVSTWKARGGFGTAPHNELSDFVRASLRDPINDFVNAYLAANPKQ